MIFYFVTMFYNTHIFNVAIHDSVGDTWMNLSYMQPRLVRKYLGRPWHRKTPGLVAGSKLEGSGERNYTYH